jgi:tetratricopeptide (TPR) repeat protein
MFDPEDLKEMKEKELWAILSDSEIFDEFNIRRELRNRLWQQNEYGQVVEMCDHIIRVARIIDEEEAVIAGEYYTKGSAHFNAKEFLAAVEAYGNASAMYEKIGDQGQLANSLWAKADSLYQLDDDQLSADLALQSSRLFESENSIADAGKSMYLRARALYYSEQYEESLNAVIEARNLYRVIGNTEDVAYIDNFRVTILNTLSRPEECIEVLRVCLFIWQTLPTNSHTLEWQAFTARRLADFLFRGDAIDEAMEYYEQAKLNYKECEKFDEIAACEYGIGKCQDTLGKFDEAMKSFLQARALADVNGKDELSVDAEVARAISLHRSRRYEDARLLNLRILSGLESNLSSDNNDTAHRVRVRAADNSLALNEWENAIYLLDQLPDYPNFEPVLQIVIWAMSIRARALFELGRFEEAYRVADNAIGETNESLINWVTAYLYEVRGKILLFDENRDGIQDLAHAIALHLANDEDNQARILSEYFLPTNDFSRQLFQNREIESENRDDDAPVKSESMEISSPLDGLNPNSNQCGHCGHIFVDMVSHYTDAHLLVKCETCGSEIAGMLALESHEKVRHTG